MHGRGPARCASTCTSAIRVATPSSCAASTAAPSISPIDGVSSGQSARRMPGHPPDQAPPAAREPVGPSQTVLLAVGSTHAQRLAGRPSKPRFADAALIREHDPAVAGTRRPGAIDIGRSLIRSPANLVAPRRNLVGAGSRRASRRSTTTPSIDSSNGIPLAVDGGDEAPGSTICRMPAGSAQKRECHSRATRRRAGAIALRRRARGHEKWSPRLP